MKTQLLHSHPVTTNLLWDNLVALFSLAALGVIVMYLAVG